MQIEVTYRLPNTTPTPHGLNTRNTPCMPPKKQVLSMDNTEVCNHFEIAECVNLWRKAHSLSIIPFTDFISFKIMPVAPEFVKHLATARRNIPELDLVNYKAEFMDMLLIYDLTFQELIDKIELMFNWK